jgi:hypothetical protein
MAVPLRVRLASQRPAKVPAVADAPKPAMTAAKPSKVLEILIRSFLIGNSLTGLSGPIAARISLPYLGLLVVIPPLLGQAWLRGQQDFEDGSAIFPREFRERR